MNRYTIAPVSGAIHWDSVQWLTLENYMWGTETDITMAAQLCYSDAGIHVHLKAKEAHIRAEEPIPYGVACQDSCMEFFFRPDEQDGRYFNIEVGAGGCVHIGLGHYRHDSVRLIPRKDQAMKDMQINRTEDGWEVFYTFSTDFIRVFFPGYQLLPGRKIAANLYKCGGLTVKKHYIVWNFIGTEKPDYHQPDYFGEMILG